LLRLLLLLLLLLLLEELMKEGELGKVSQLLVEEVLHLAHLHVLLHQHRAHVFHLGAQIVIRRDQVIGMPLIRVRRRIRCEHGRPPHRLQLLAEPRKVPPRTGHFQ
jgi:hypothetical protein